MPAKKLLDLPKKVKVGPHIYKIEEWETKAAVSSEKMGECSHIEHIIRVTTAYPSHTANTLLHEIMHACCEIWNVESDDNEERHVTALTNALQSVWKENPEVIAFLNQEFSNGR